MMTLERFKQNCLEHEDFTDDDRELVEVTQGARYFCYSSATKIIKYDFKASQWLARGIPKGIFQWEWHVADSLETALRAKQDRYDYVYP